MKQCTCYALRAVDCTCKPAKYGELYTSPTAKQEQGEPDKYLMDIECTNCGAKQSGVLTVNTTPQQRTWVGLTDEDRDGFVQKYWNDELTTMRSMMKDVEAKLKEKNGL
jgi:hypothetical protein